MVHVQRRPDIEEVRRGLPITGMEQEVMEAMLQHDVVVLCGETGCGKTTQVRSGPEQSGQAGVCCQALLRSLSLAVNTV